MRIRKRWLIDMGQAYQISNVLECPNEVVCITVLLLNFFFKLYNIVLVLPYINMNLPHMARSASIVGISFPFQQQVPPGSLWRAVGLHIPICVAAKIAPTPPHSLGVRNAKN